MIFKSAAGTAIAFAVLFVCAGARAAEKQSTPDVAAKTFYRIYAQAHAIDIPDAKHRAVWKPILSGDLYALIVQGGDAEKRWAEKNKKEPAPPLFEGDLFSSMVEGNAQLRRVSCEPDGDKALCTASLHRIEQSRVKGKLHEKDLSWDDKLFLIHTARGWRVDDLEYGGQWDFGPKGRMTAILEDVDRLSRED